MILEGFEIENWACVKRLAVAELPATGVIVLHGPNRTGKSSIVQALRACLMDYPSNSKAQEITSLFPRGTGEKPTVSITFRTDGGAYRIKKCFGTNKSELASRTATGAWKVETTDHGEAHRRTCAFAGGDDSAKGLHQLLWLTQAEFRLPDRKQFDSAVQAQLRGLLGVLQTGLDDRFIKRVKARWNEWYRDQRKPGKAPKMKETCRLAQNLASLGKEQKELGESDAKFMEVEQLLRQTGELESQRQDLQRQRDDCSRHLAKMEAEYERSQQRIRARREAIKEHEAAEKERESILQEQARRDEAAQRLRSDESRLRPAEQENESAQRHAEQAQLELARQRKRLSDLRENRRDLQKRVAEIDSALRRLALRDELDVAAKELERAQAVAREKELIETFLADHPAPDKKQFESLKANRQQYSQLKAEQDAASMSLTVQCQPEASPADLVVDGEAPSHLQTSGEPLVYQVRRKASLRIAGWGSIELTRGAVDNLDDIEARLRDCQEAFSDAVSPLGVAPSDPNALDELVRRAEQRRLKEEDLKKLNQQFKAIAPKGLEPLQAKLIELRTKLNDSPGDVSPAPLPPQEAEELKAAAATIGDEANSLDAQIANAEIDVHRLEDHLATATDKLTAAKVALAEITAMAARSREVLDGLAGEEKIKARLEAANAVLAESQARLKTTELTAEETTIDDRLAAAKGTARALAMQFEENLRSYDVIKGRLQESEGLHARRSALAARVDELTCLTARESLERDAIDRLYELFEECREKQFGAVMAPLEDRIVRWLQLLDIGDYKQMRFSDAFLPEKLVNGDGTAEFAIDEESTGAQEQIGMLVRLALGSTLASISEPAIAVLDDPLTHCDAVRLGKMRHILHRAAEGDSAMTPPAGPLQILIFTCHPEWFRDDKAAVIDLSDPAILSRYTV